MCRKARTIWSRLDCLKPNPQWCQFHTRRYDVWNRRCAMPWLDIRIGATSVAHSAAQRGRTRG